MRELLVSEVSDVSDVSDAATDHIVLQPRAGTAKFMRRRIQRLTLASPPPYWKRGERMGKDAERNSKPIAERIKERVRDFVDGAVESLDLLINPRPAPIPVRIRR